MEHEEALAWKALHWKVAGRPGTHRDRGLGPWEVSNNQWALGGYLPGL